MGPSILVVDDDPVICTLINRVLTRGGYHVREAEDGLQAVAMIAVERPTLVLTDLMMPGMKGNELAGRLTQRPDPIPCILMSALHRHPPIATVPFLGKPFALEALLDLVANMVQESRCLTP